jgi:hypothetical protein
MNLLVAGPVTFRLVEFVNFIVVVKCFVSDRLCGLVVRVPGYRSEVCVRFPSLTDFLRSTGSGMGYTQPLNTIEELLGRKSSDSGPERREYGRMR